MVPSYAGSNPAAPASLIAAALALLATPVRAQQQDGQAWLQVNTNVPVAERWRVTLEQIARFSDRQDGLYQTEFGGLIGYRVADGVELGAGYRKVGFHGGNRAANEDRLRQQVAITAGRLSARLRLDERLSDAGGGIGLRIRPLLRYTHPLGRPGFAAFVSHESFFLPNSTSWGQRAGYERMRNVAGLTVPVGQQVSADLGYLNQYRFARSGLRAQMDHALTVQLTINLRPAAHPPADD